MSIITSTSGANTLEFNDAPTARQRYKLNGKPVVGVTTFIKAGLPTPEALQSWKAGKAAEYAYDKLTFELNDSFDQTGKFTWPSKDTQEQIIKDSKISWKKFSEEAAGIGVIVHDYAYLSSLKRNEEALEKLSEYEGTEHWNEILNAISKVDEFNKQNKDEIVALETLVASPSYQYGGRFDRLTRRNNLLILSDYKTSKGFYLEQFIQDAAYSIAIEEWLGLKVDAYEVIRFGKEGGDFKQLLITEPEELKIFKDQALRCLSTYEFSKKWNKDERFVYGGK